MITRDRMLHSKVHHVGPEPREWVNVAVNLNAQIVGVRRDGQLDVFEYSSSKGFGIHSLEYVHTGSHTPINKGGDPSMAKYQVVVKPDEDGGFVVECPTIPGCMSQGETIEEALENIKEAIQGCIEARRELGMPLTMDVYEVEV